MKLYEIKPEWCWGDDSEQKKAIQTEALAAVGNCSIERLKMSELPGFIESEYEERTGESEMVCPYCGYSHHVDVSHNTIPDCSLNDSEHTYAERYSQHHTKVEECTTCDHTRYGEPLVK